MHTIVNSVLLYCIVLYSQCIYFVIVKCNNVTILCKVLHLYLVFILKTHIWQSYIYSRLDELSKLSLFYYFFFCHAYIMHIFQQPSTYIYDINVNCFFMFLYYFFFFLYTGIPKVDFRLYEFNITAIKMIYEY